MDRETKTIQEIRREFIEFLKKYHALKFYRENFIQQRKNNFDNIICYINPFAYLLLKEKIASILIFSFHWDETPQGRHYWYRLSCEWMRICDNYNVMR